MDCDYLTGGSPSAGLAGTIGTKPVVFVAFRTGSQGFSKTPTKPSSTGHDSRHRFSRGSTGQRERTRPMRTFSSPSILPQLRRTPP